MKAYRLGHIATLLISLGAIILLFSFVSPTSTAIIWIFIGLWVVLLSSMFAFFLSVRYALYLGLIVGYLLYLFWKHLFAFDLLAYGIFILATIELIARMRK